MPYKVTNEMIRQAKRIRKKRDKVYSNRFDPKEHGKEDRRWVGDLGEVVLNVFLAALRVDYEWLVDGDVTALPDFIVNGVMLDAKTTRRVTYPKKKDDYEVGIPPSALRAVIDEFFFMWYEEPKDKMWLLGSITKADFMYNSYFLKKGELCRCGTMRASHDSHQINLTHLTFPMEITWLRSEANNVQEGNQAV